MQVILAFLIGGLFAVAIYMLLRRTFARVIIGLALLTNATNLLIFTVGGLTRAAPPLIPDGQYRPTQPIADPMPQSLILTAIVIGFGVLAFMMVLAFRTTQVVVADDTDRMRLTDALVPAEMTDLAEPYDEEAESHPDEATDAARQEEAE
jgi:multicomponent Na+:H+ antiporter subunit C